MCPFCKMLFARNLLTLQLCLEKIATIHKFAFVHVKLQTDLRLLVNFLFRNILKRNWTFVSNVQI
jgi:hypothetical protein